MLTSGELWVLVVVFYFENPGAIYAQVTGDKFTVHR